MPIFIVLPIIILFSLFVLFILLGPVSVKSNEVAIVEKKYARKTLKNGDFIALNGEAGYQVNVLRTGLHFRCRIIYKIHKQPAITIKQGEIGYVFARSGKPLATDQVLGKYVDCDNFQDTRLFLENEGQKGPQRYILREGTYFINLAQFIVATRAKTYFLSIGDRNESEAIKDMSREIEKRNGFEPVIIASHNDEMGIIVTFEGKTLEQGEIIAPTVGTNSADSNSYHNSFQNIEAFLSAGGYKGRQYQVLTEGTYYINRLFATVEFEKKTYIGVSHVGVVNSYVGTKGIDLSGEKYTHGELVEQGTKGIWKEALSPGKYAFNPYAGEIIQVPTDNFALKWIDNETGQYNYDKDLRALSVITKDGFQPSIPLSVIVHINYKEAPLMIQRFGSVEKLVNQTLDTIISSYFKQVAENKTFLEIVQNKASIASEVQEKMKEEFKNFNLELEGVLIDTPKSNNDTRIDSLIEQLSERQLSKERVATYKSQMDAEEQKKSLNEMTAKAEQQASLTASSIQISIKENQAEAERKVAVKNAEKLKVEADAEKYQIEQMALAESDKIIKIADATAHQEKEVGLAIAEATEKQVEAYGGADLLVSKEIAEAFAEAIKTGQIPIVPTNLITNDSKGGTNGMETISQLVSMDYLQRMVKSSSADNLTDSTLKENKIESDNKEDVNLTNDI